jgi:NADH:ubiquinone oxidoreductase subunit E
MKLRQLSHTYVYQFLKHSVTCILDILREYYIYITYHTTHTQKKCLECNYIYRHTLVNFYSLKNIFKAQKRRGWSDLKTQLGGEQ